MYSTHTHTGESNMSRGFADSSIKLEDMVARAKEIGLSGIAITDHETVGSFVQAKQLEEKYDFPVICGNEVYLVDDKQYDALRYNYDKDTMYFPHFILLAKDKIGAFQLMELSTRAWVKNSFKTSIIRTPLKFSDLYDIIGDDRGHIIAQTACLGGTIPKLLLKERDGLISPHKARKGIDTFIKKCQNIFLKENFFLEVQPATEYQQDQIYVNDKIKELSKQYDIRYTITTDAHYLKKESLDIHSAFLNSDDSDDREAYDFYRTAYLMSEQEVRDYFTPYWTDEEIQHGIDTSMMIGESCERYNFNRKQKVPEVDFEEGWEDKLDYSFFPKGYEYIQKTLNSEKHQDRYLMYKIQVGMQKFIPFKDLVPTFERVEQELEEFYYISIKIDDIIGNYFITISKLIEIVWDAEGGDSLVGVGRGSCVSSMVAYLLEITQLNPIKQPVEMPFYRFMDRERAELPDVDFDTQSNRRTRIFNAVYKYIVSRGGDVVNCCTKGVYGSKSALKTAGRGLGLNADEYNPVASIIPVIRGFTRSLSDCYYGNKDEEIEPIPEFVNAINKLEKRVQEIAEKKGEIAKSGLLETAMLIEGVVINRGVHASGVFITNTPFEEFGAKMKSPKGIITSQWDLKGSELAGALKYDFLTVSALDKIRLAMEYLIINGHIEKQATLKETYLKYFSIDNLEYDTPQCWANINANNIPDLFQFDSLVSVDAIHLINPDSLVKLAQTNSIMRLQQQKGAKETPTQTYARFIREPNAWDDEMNQWAVPLHERKAIREVLDVYHGIADTQEAMMSLVRHKEISGFNVKEAHQIRKAVSKKKEALMKEAHVLFVEKAREIGLSENSISYLWDVQIMRQASYSFSILHTLAYTFIALIQVVIYTKYPSIYWNCATLSVNSEAVDEDEVYSDSEDAWIDEADDEIKEGYQEESGSNSIDYGKVASAIAKLQGKGVNVELPDINDSYLSFYPNEKDDLIMFGMKGVSGINDEDVNTIIEHRPYTGLKDFHERLVLTKKEVVEGDKVKYKSLITYGKTVTLIKSGAFDKVEGKDRKDILKDYILTNFPPKEKVTFQNFNDIWNSGIMPNSLKKEVSIYKFYKFIVNKNRIIENTEVQGKKWYSLTSKNPKVQRKTDLFFEKYFEAHLTEDEDYKYVVHTDDKGNCTSHKVVLAGTKSCKFNKIYEKLIEPIVEWMQSDDCINRYNEYLFNKKWYEATKGKESISGWEMATVGFYYNEHELKKVDRDFYSIVNPFTLGENSKVVGYNVWREIEFPKYELHNICGTVVSRDKDKQLLTLLTPDGALNIKYDKGQFVHYDKEVSMVNSKGNKKTLEKGWFKRGNMLIIQGYLKNGRFKPKKYRDSIWKHTTILIEEINADGTLQLKMERTRAE